MLKTMPWQTPQAYWMQEGPDQDVILSTRIRLARNISGLPYPNFQTEENAQTLLQEVEALIPLLEERTANRWQLFRLSQRNEAQKSILVDKHLMSPSLNERTSQAGLLLREDEAVSINNRRRADILAAGPERRARRGATGAQDTLGGIVEALARLDALQAFLLGGRFVVDEIGHHRLIMLEERLHINNQVFDHGQPKHRLHQDFVRAEVVHQHLARQAVVPVDAHSIGAAHPMRA